MSYRLNSPKGKVQFEYDQHGEAAAAKLAADLGIASKTKRWFAQWADKAPARIVNGEKHPGRRRVRVASCPRQPSHVGTVLREGPEQCEVQFDDRSVRIVPTSWLITQVKKQPVAVNAAKVSTKLRDGVEHTKSKRGE